MESLFRGVGVVYVWVNALLYIFFYLFSVTHHHLCWSSLPQLWIRRQIWVVCLDRYLLRVPNHTHWCVRRVPVLHAHKQKNSKWIVSGTTRSFPSCNCVVTRCLVPFRMHSTASAVVFCSSPQELSPSTTSSTRSTTRSCRTLVSRRDPSPSSTVWHSSSTPSSASRASKTWPYSPRINYVFFSYKLLSYLSVSRYTFHSCICFELFFLLVPPLTNVCLPRVNTTAFFY